MSKLVRAIVLVVILICAIIMAGVIAASHATYSGGAAKRLATAPTHVVVDTLNLTHWINTTAKRSPVITSELIASTIDKTAPLLHKQYPGRVMYVVKDRESVLNDPSVRVVYSDVATRNSAYIYAVERYEEPPTATSKNPKEHSARGRDDLYMAMLARKWKCPVLTEDRFRDFEGFRENVDPFHVYEFAYWRPLPARDYVRPDTLRGLKPPHAVRYAPHFGAPADLRN